MSSISVKKTILPLLFALGIIGSASVHADTFGTGANQFTIDFTTIGNAGNAADTTGYGSVGYTTVLAPIPSRRIRLMPLLPPV